MKTCSHPRILVSFALLSFISASALAADDSFTGKWKLNPDKSQFAGLNFKFEDITGGKYSFAFGDDVENLVLHGKDHTWAFTQTGPNKWKWTRKRDGKVIAVSNWTVSDDGQTFSSSRESMRPDGSTSHEEMKFKRNAGTCGLVGIWERTELKMSSPATLEI